MTKRIKRKPQKIKKERAGHSFRPKAIKRNTVPKMEIPNDAMKNNGCHNFPSRTDANESGIKLRLPRLSAAGSLTQRSVSFSSSRNLDTQLPHPRTVTKKRRMPPLSKFKTIKPSSKT